METKVLPVIGTKIIAKYIPNITGTSADLGCTGMTVTVTDMSTARYTWGNLVDEASGNASYMPSVYARFTREGGGDIGYWITDWDVVDPDVLPEPPAVIIVPTIEDTLRTRVTEITHERDNQRRQAINAFKVVSDRLIVEAENRGWCDIFDTIVTDVNDDNPSWLQLEVRERDFELSTRVTLVMTLTTTERATSLEDAISLANDNDLNSLIMEQARYGDYEIEEMDWEES